jgi:ribosomal protein S18 acetylase RimI-like enzyme
MNQTGIIELVQKGVSKFQVREFYDKDTREICSWVTTREALQLVSGNTADYLTPIILEQWASDACKCLVVSDQVTDRAVGFCTLSNNELPNLPENYIELCHLIVNPQYRYLFIASRLCRTAKTVASDFGFKFLCGRVKPTNRYTLALARLQRFQEFTNESSWAVSGFRWFRFAVSHFGHRNNTLLSHLETNE